jgi:CRISPR-associated protein Csb3
MTICLHMDPTNPGEFFACCGLLELAHRLWARSHGWFDANAFLLSTSTSPSSLKDLLVAAQSIRLADEDSDSSDAPESEDDVEDERPLPAVEPITIASPIRLRLDWWADKSLKTWAGSMDARRIFLAMCNAIDPSNPDPLRQRQIVFDREESATSSKKVQRLKEPKKREPFYFDARRGANALSIDVGFAPDALKLNTITHPAVEALCFLGLQRCRPFKTETPRVFDYFTWSVPLSASVVPAAVCGFLPSVNSRGFRFENAFRTDQRKHKAFNPAIPHGGFK